MDHPFLLSWGLADEPFGTFRGPGSTSGIETLRDGPYRADHAAFRVDIDNWGFGILGAPVTDVTGGSVRPTACTAPRCASGWPTWCPASCSSASSSNSSRTPTTG